MRFYFATFGRPKSLIFHSRGKEEHMAAPVTHFEIMAKDAQRMRDFYAGLFGWSFNDMPEMSYGMIDTGVKMGINGGIGQVQENQVPCVTFYVQVEDIQGHLDKAVGLGATIVVPVREFPGMVTFAQFKDPDGNMVGLVQGPQDAPKPARAKRVRGKKAAAKKKTARRKPVARRKGRK
jgi:predicted enzyme related to lactoylglutathione lyase